jgi:hypothetical protein
MAAGACDPEVFGELFGLIELENEGRGPRADLTEGELLLSLIYAPC